jgi:hypothetical protein
MANSASLTPDPDPAYSRQESANPKTRFVPAGESVPHRVDTRWLDAGSILA